MVEPTTVNKALIIPNTGDLPGTWGSAAINPDMAAIDGMFGGVSTISLSSSNVTLTVPAGFVATPSAGPTQSQNAVVRLTGNLTTNVAVFFPMPGYYIVENLCTNIISFVVRLSAPGFPGQVVCAPPGEACHVYFDGTNTKYVNFGRVGGYWDISSTGVPNWVNSCTVPPYLNCDGSSFSSVTYPVLAAMLGGTVLPDLRGRVRGYLNQGTGRLTSGFGINGDVFLAQGGSQGYQIQQAHLPPITLSVTIPAGQGSHAHGYLQAASPQQKPASGGSAPFTATVSATTDPATLPDLFGSAPLGGSGAFFPVVPPMAIGGLTLIRAA